EKELACHKAVVYNNLGRLYLIQHKPQKALDFYKKALKIAIAANEDMKLLHCCYSNVIDQLIIQNAPDEEISRYYNEYKKIITKESITNKIAFYNFKLGADRQRNIIDNEHQRFFQMYTELLKVAIGDEKYALEICAFTTLFYYGKKARQELLLVINDIKTDFDKYQNLELLNKLNIYKNLLYTLETGQEEINKICKDIADKIKHYYRTAAINEIKDKLIKLDEYQVYCSCELIFNEIYIRSRNENYNNFSKLIELFDDILEEYKKEGLYFSKLNILLFVAEECMAYQLCDAKDRTRHPDIMKKYVDLAINEIKKTKNFPGMEILHLRAAYCLYYLGRIIESQEHFNFIQSSSYSINHLPCLYKEKYYELQNNLPKLLSFLLMKSQNNLIQLGSDLHKGHLQQPRGSRKTGKGFCRERKTGADGRDRSLLSERGSFAYYRKVPSECRYYSPFCLIFQGKLVVGWEKLAPGFRCPSKNVKPPV
ncbi:MAG: tetratricopeptide repeat protein, partial [Candidatus Altimarinota bacterium]